MRDNLVILDRALNAANKAGAFTLQEAIAIINSFQSVVNYIGQYEDLSEPKQETETEDVETEAPKKVKKTKTV